MKKILSLVTSHVRQDFQLNYYVTIIFFLTAFLILNYSVDLETSWIDRDNDNPIRMPLYFSLYGFGYFISCLIVFQYKKIKHVWRSKKFWVFSLVGLSVLSLDKGFPYLQSIMNSLQQPYDVYAWLFQIAANMTSFGLVFLPLFVFSKAFDNQKSRLYGLCTYSNLMPYAYLLLIIAPVIFIASLETSFTDYYPIYKSNMVAELWNWPSYFPMLIFEIFYGLDFLNVEFLFRGFFVIGMSHVLGKHSIIPMVVLYCFLHFGKPAGEAISSIFGGYILGVLAFYTRSIWGGIIIHVGVAWMMEAGAYFSKHF